MTIKKHSREVIRRLIILTAVVAFGTTLLTPIVHASEHPWGSGPRPPLDEPVSDQPWGTNQLKATSVSGPSVWVIVLNSVRIYFLGTTVHKDNRQLNRRGTHGPAVIESTGGSSRPVAE